MKTGPYCICIIISSVYQTVFNFHNRVGVLASLKRQDQIPDFIEQIHDIWSQTEKNENIMLSVGIGSLYKGAELISKTYIEAGKALTYQISRHCPGPVRYSEIGINRLFINLPREEALAFLREVFNPLKNLPQNHGCQLIETLVTYVDLNCSAVKTAEKLFIHINTLYQRLARIEECLHISPDNPEDVLKIRLACYLRNSYGE